MLHPCSIGCHGEVVRRQPPATAASSEGGMLDGEATFAPVYRARHPHCGQLSAPTNLSSTCKHHLYTTVH